MHRFLRIKGGFLRVDLDCTKRTLQSNHLAVDGRVVYHETIQAE